MERRDRIPERVRRAFPGLMLVMFLATVDQTAMASALPSVAGDLGGPEHMPLIVAAYFVAATAAMPAAGFLGDRAGHRRVLLGGLAVFVLGASLCASAAGVPQLVAYRTLQGLGGGTLMIGAQATLGELVSPRERGRYLGLLGIAFMAAAVIGPLVGGAVVDLASWRWIFLGYVPLAAGAAYAIVRGIRLTPPTRHAGPSMPRALWRDPAFVLAVAVSFLVGFAMFSSIAYLPAYLQIALGASATASGAVLLLLMVALLTAAIASGAVVSRTGRYRAFPVAGMALAAAGQGTLALLGPAGGLPAAAASVALTGLGVGLTMQIMVAVAQNAATRETLGAATSAVALVRQAGAAAGVVGLGAILTAGFVARLPEEAIRVLGDRAGSLDPESLATLPPGIAGDVSAAFGAALPPVAAASAAVLAVAFVLTLFLPERELRTEAFAEGRGQTPGGRHA
ncbi:MFS transporter [Sinomonas mesophila]|uniref:MFS transporter n=1 Tax=Sinomonas mesophila TaxID=1531955 RepID=UPI0009871D12|nr:MFS transporter [Sinomonas mesophila]